MGAPDDITLNATGIKVFGAVSGSVENIISTFDAQNFEELTAQNVCASHGCH